MCVPQQFQHVLNMLASYNPVWRGGEISVIMTLPIPRREVEKSWLTLLLSRGLMWSVTESTQETHWSMCFVLSIAQGMAWFSRSRQKQMFPDVSRLWENMEILSANEGFQSVSTSPAGTSALFLAQLIPHPLPWQKWVGQGWGTYHLQKISILLCPGEKMILCPQNFKMLCCGSNKLGWDSEVRALHSVLRGREADAELPGMWKAHQHWAAGIPSHGKEVCSSPTTS